MREQNRNKNQEIEEILEQMDLSQPAPETEPMRQYWFMKKARELVKEQSEKLGRTPDSVHDNIWLPNECAGFRKTSWSIRANRIPGRNKRGRCGFCHLQYMHCAGKR